MEKLPDSRLGAFFVWCRPTSLNRHGPHGDSTRRFSLTVSKSGSWPRANNVDASGSLSVRGANQGRSMKNQAFALGFLLGKAKKRLPYAERQPRSARRRRLSFGQRAVVGESVLGLDTQHPCLGDVQKMNVLGREPSNSSKKWKKGGGNSKK